MLVLVFGLICTLGHTQDRKAYGMYLEEDYAGVVKYYDAKNLTHDDVIILSKSLVQVGNFERALELSYLLQKEHAHDPEAAINYYEILTQTYQFPKAFDYLESKKNILSESKSDSLDKSLMQYMVWEYDKLPYEVKPITEANTLQSEYAPVFYFRLLHYCTLEEIENLNQEHYDIHSLHIPELDSIKKGKEDEFSLKGLTYSKHTNIGPFCIQDGKIYFTVSTKNFKGENILKIIVGDVDEKGKVTNQKELKLADRNHSAAHPTLSEDGQRLFFSSDVPGGYGGMDLYVAYKVPNGWSTPINLGEWVNTADNELFPRCFDNKVYFASDGLPGYGGLDIYQVSDDDTYEEVANLGRPINSIFDDFGIFYMDAFKGFFSSNRPGDKGNDDIYSFNLPRDLVEKEKETPKITGVMQQNGSAIANKEVFLMDEDGNVLEVVTTDENGAFMFTRQPDPSRYIVELAEPLANGSGASMLLTDDVGNITEELKMNSKGQFVFEMFALDEVKALSKFTIYETDPYKISLYGYVFRETPGDLNAITNLAINDENHNEIAYVKTDRDGKFTAEDIDYGQRYLIQAETSDSVKIVMFDQNDNKQAELFSPGNNLFAYENIGKTENLLAIVDQNNSVEIVSTEEKIKIPNIYYGYNSAKLNGKAKKSLTNLVITMQNNQGLVIELHSHTDIRGTAESNQVLSEKRALSAKDYLVKKGINGDRIKAVGFGWSRPIIDCENQDCQETDHALNRRTEFQIVSN